MQDDFTFQIPAVGDTTRNKCNEIIAIRYCFNCGTKLPLFYHCKKWSCPKCAYSSAQRAASRIEEQLNGVFQANIGYMKTGKPKHVSIHPPKHIVKKKTEKQLRELAYYYAKSIGILGGVMVVHHWRVHAKYKKRILKYNKESSIQGGHWRGVQLDVLGLGDWRKYCYFSPHFHFIGFYPKTRIKSNNFEEKTKWTYTAHAVTKERDVIKTATYLLTHQAIKKNRDSYTYFGIAHTSQFSIEEIHINVDAQCPECGSDQYFNLPCTTESYEKILSGEIIPHAPLSIFLGGSHLHVRHKKTIKVYHNKMESNKNMVTNTEDKELSLIKSYIRTVQTVTT